MSRRELSEATEHAPIPPARCLAFLRGEALPDADELDQLGDALLLPPNAKQGLGDVVARQDLRRFQEKLTELMQSSLVGRRLHAVGAPSAHEGLSELTRAGVAEITIRKIESGAMVPSGALVDRLIDALGIDDAGEKRTLRAWASLGAQNIREAARAIADLLLDDKVGRELWPYFTTAWGEGPPVRRDEPSVMHRISDSSPVSVAFAVEGAVSSELGQLPLLAEARREPVPRAWQGPLMKRWRYLPALPPLRAAEPDGLASRIRGMLWGAAVGDALSNRFSGVSPVERRTLMIAEGMRTVEALRARGGPDEAIALAEAAIERARRDERHVITGYLPDPRADWAVTGIPIGDTEVSFETVRHLVERGRLEPGALMAAFSARSPIHRVGNSTQRAVRAFDEGKPWDRCGARSAGNGALMRIAPTVLPYLGGSSTDQWHDVVAATVLTHADAAAIGASLGFVFVLRELLARPVGEVPASGWWIETFLRAAEDQTRARNLKAPKGSPLEDFTGRLSIDTVLSDLKAQLATGTVASLERRYWSGAFLLETVPMTLAILELHAAEPREALLAAVNGTLDNDTIAGLVGAAVGALHGLDALPREWRDGHCGYLASPFARERPDEDRLEPLIDAAVQRFVTDADAGE
ncbi:MAG: hypothetical protein EP329_28350 [Deltaproteobacteria bacterium]|nr:MAG: hypothetical protein EP329_28350 [Deltaproteobacteria bacterium]